MIIYHIIIENQLMILSEKQSESKKICWQEPIKKLQKQHIHQMQRFASPPPGAYSVFVAIGILFASNKDKDSTMMQFYNIYDKQLSSSPQKLLYMMSNLDASLVPLYRVKIIQKWLIQSGVNEKNLPSQSYTASVYYEWLQAFFKERIILEEKQKQKQK